MAAKKQAPEAPSPQGITIPRFNWARLSIRIVGISPLVVNRFKSDKMAADQQGKVVGPRKFKDPRALCEAALHRDEEGRIAMPAICFKKAIVSCVDFRRDKMSMAKARGMLFVDQQFVRILDPVTGGDPEWSVYEATVRNANKVADIRYRPMIARWAAEIPIRFDADAMTPQHIVYWTHLAGVRNGLGDGRAEKSSCLDYGQFEIDKVAVPGLAKDEVA